MKNETELTDETANIGKLMLGDVEIIDAYKNIGFKKISDLAELKVGMQIQIVDRNIIPLKWTWKIVDEMFLIKISEINCYSKYPKEGKFMWKGQIPSDIVEWCELKPNYNVLDWIRIINIA